MLRTPAVLRTDSATSDATSAQSLQGIGNDIAGLSAASSRTTLPDVDDGDEGDDVVTRQRLSAIQTACEFRRPGRLLLALTTERCVQTSTAPLDVLPMSTVSSQAFPLRPRTTTPPFRCGSRLDRFRYGQ